MKNFLLAVWAAALVGILATLFMVGHANDLAEENGKILKESYQTLTETLEGLHEETPIN